MLHEAIYVRFGNVVEVLLRIEMNQSRLLIDYFSEIIYVKFYVRFLIAF